MCVHCFNPFSQDAVKDFQQFAGLEVTGEMDPVTVELMGTPRCGVSDKKRSDGDKVNLGMSGAYVLQGSRWQVKQLSYRCVDITDDTWSKLCIF